MSLIESGAVLGLTIMDHDFLVPDDYIGEVFYPLKLAHTVGDLQTIDNAPVVMLPVRRPHLFNSPEFEVSIKKLVDIIHKKCPFSYKD